MDWNINIKDIVTLSRHSQFIFGNLIVNFSQCLLYVFNKYRISHRNGCLSVCLPPLINRKRVLDSLKPINKVL